MDGFEVDAHRLRGHARHVRSHAHEVTALAGAAATMACDAGAFGLVLAPLGVTLSLLEQQCAGVVRAAGELLDATAAGLRATATAYEVVDEAVAHAFRRAAAR